MSHLFNILFSIVVRLICFEIDVLVYLCGFYVRIRFTCRTPIDVASVRMLHESSHARYSFVVSSILAAVRSSGDKDR